jgi:DNA polymerase
MAELLRAASAHLELEQFFGVDAWDMPAPEPAPAAAARPQRELPPWLKRREQKSPKPPPAEAPEPAGQPVRVKGRRGPDLLTAKDYEIDMPDGLSKQEQLDHFAKCMADCSLCRLCQGRTQVVFGVGDPDVDLMFIGEAPGRDEDAQGIPFVGRAGQLLTKIIEAMGFSRDDVYIANINKCRPPNNRAPTPEEMDACMPYLLRQLDIIEPKVICLLGATAVRGLLDVKKGITKLRGEFMEWRGIQVMPTYHPAYLLRNPPAKRDVWEDVQKVRDALRGG